MTRHPIRWSSLAFGLLFLSGVGQWAVRTEDLLTSRVLSLTTSAVLIVLGLLGVVATLWKPTSSGLTSSARTPPAHSVPTTTPEGPEDEEIDPQP